MCKAVLCLACAQFFPQEVYAKAHPATPHVLVAYRASAMACTLLLLN
jgi:hypothetical protein